MKTVISMVSVLQIQSKPKSDIPDNIRNVERDKVVLLVYMYRGTLPHAYNLTPMTLCQPYLAFTHCTYPILSS